MNRINLNNVTPFEATHVGETIKDELSAINMKQSELAELTGIQKPILNDIIKGKRSLTSEMALLIEKAIGIPSSFLMNMQLQYELDCAKISEKVIQQTKIMEFWKILKDNICIAFFKKVGVLKDNIAENVQMIFTIFGVKSIDEFLELKAKEMELSYYKKSEKRITNPNDIFSWKYYCYYLSKQIDYQDSAFSNDNVTTLIKELNKIFLDNCNTINKTKETLKRHGIKFLHVKKVGQVPVDGMSFWTGANPTIVVTERIPTIDNFAFTVFHELGHVFNHLQKDGTALINIDGDNKDLIENQADEFACNAIIPHHEWKRFITIFKRIAPYKIAPYIKEESIRLGINPQILYGRYKHDMGVYQLKKVFDTNIN